MQIAIIGTGYVGLTTGACLAHLGHTVRCYDLDTSRMDVLRRGEVPIFEPGLSEMIGRNVEAGRLSFIEDPTDAVRGCKFAFIAVGTPSKSCGRIDLSYVEAAASDLATLMPAGSTIVIKSTVEVGTARKLSHLIAMKRGDQQVTIGVNPEFLREGSAIRDFLEPDRIVCGADDPVTAERLGRIYAPLTSRGAELVQLTTVDAELSKCTANAFLALKIGFINDVADLCEKTEGDVRAVAHAIGLDHRIGRAFLDAGPGYGGSCFPKDTRAFAATGRRFQASQGLVETLIERNEERKRKLARRIIQALPVSGSRRVGVLGTAFKQQTDDMRESPALTIIEVLEDAGVEVSAYDPEAMRNGRRLLPRTIWASCPYEAATDVDALVILTEWPSFRSLDLKNLSKVMRGRKLFDFRNVLDARKCKSVGLKHIGVGRGTDLGMGYQGGEARLQRPL